MSGMYTLHLLREAILDRLAHARPGSEEERRLRQQLQRLDRAVHRDFLIEMWIVALFFITTVIGVCLLVITGD